MKLQGYTELDKLLRRLQTGFVRRVRSKGQRAVMEQVQKQTLRRWRTKKSPEGTPWKRWSSAYARTRNSVLHNLNMDSHALVTELEDETTIQADGDDLIYGSWLWYAPFVQKARPFLGVNDQDADELQETLDRFAEKEAPRFGLA